jgi:hypothetical protein
LSGAFGNGTQAVNARLNGHLAATLDGVNLLAERVKASALARIGKQPQLIIAAAWRNGAANKLRLLWGPKGDSG